jgi:hypothetical protein
MVQDASNHTVGEAPLAATPSDSAKSHGALLADLSERMGGLLDPHGMAKYVSSETAHTVMKDRSMVELKAAIAEQVDHLAKYQLLWVACLTAQPEEAYALVRENLLAVSANGNVRGRFCQIHLLGRLPASVSGAWLEELLTGKGALALAANWQIDEEALDYDIAVEEYIPAIRESAAVALAIQGTPSSLSLLQSIYDGNVAAATDSSSEEEWQVVAPAIEGLIYRDLLAEHGAEEAHNLYGRQDPMEIGSYCLRYLNLR